MRSEKGVKNAEVKPNALPIIGGRAGRSTTQSKFAMMRSALPLALEEL